MNAVAKTLIVAGVVLIVAGVIWQISSRFGFGLGKLPGDVSIERPGFRFYFPITTSILISVVITLIMALVRLFSKN